MLTACDKVAGKVEIVSCVTGEVPNGLRNEKAPGLLKVTPIIFVT